MGNLARYIIWALFSHERLTHIPDESKVVYRSRDGKSEKTFAALEWLATLCSHVPNKGEQMVYHYGYYSYVSRGQRKKAKEDGLVPSILQTVISCKEYLKKRARLVVSVLSIVPQRISEMARDDLRALVRGCAVWCRGMMDKTLITSLSSVPLILRL